MSQFDTVLSGGVTEALDKAFEPISPDDRRAVKAIRLTDPGPGRCLDLTLPPGAVLHPEFAPATATLHRIGDSFVIALASGGEITLRPSRPHGFDISPCLLVRPQSGLAAGRVSDGGPPSFDLMPEVAPLPPVFDPFPASAPEAAAPIPPPAPLDDFAAPLNAEFSFHGAAAQLVGFSAGTIRNLEARGLSAGGITLDYALSDDTARLVARAAGDIAFLVTLLTQGIDYSYRFALRRNLDPPEGVRPGHMLHFDIACRTDRNRMARLSVLVVDDMPELTQFGPPLQPRSSCV